MSPYEKDGKSMQEEESRMEKDAKGVGNNQQDIDEMWAIEKVNEERDSIKKNQKGVRRCREGGRMLWEVWRKKRIIRWTVLRTLKMRFCYTKNQF